MGSIDMATLGGLLGYVFASATTVVLILIANYVLSSIGYMRIANRRGMNNAWLVWIPVARNWTFGAVADNYDETKGIKRRFRVFLVVFSVIQTAILIAVSSYISMLMPYIIKYGLDLFTYDIANLALLIPVGFALLGVLIANAIYKTCYIVSLYKTFESTDAEKSLIFAILSAVFPFASGLLVFLSREKGYDYNDLIEEEETEEAPVQEENTVEEINFDN
ncbi:MAG: hypothetical protein IKV25_07405 [Clostridia bacterium]|nr:hypothetical protein [Clostridia bacterium]